MQMATTFHTGQLIKQKINGQLKSRSTLAREMGVPGTSIYAYEKRPSIQTNKLLRMCTVLRHNFFADLANLLPADYTVSVPLAREELLQQQSIEIEKLRLENKLLKELLTGRKD